MALSFGFYNSENHDRQYDAIQFGQIFDGIISDGVYANYEKAFVVKASSTAKTVIVQPGRAWFWHTWILNDADLPVTAETSELVLDRIDALCLYVDSDNRTNGLEWVKGTPASNPTKPADSSYEHSDSYRQYPIAFVYRHADSDAIAQSDIENAVGTSVCPFVTGIIQTLDASQLILQWEARFNDWFEHLSYVLDGDVAGHLQNEIDSIMSDIQTLQTDVNSHENSIISLTTKSNARDSQLTANNNLIYMDYKNGKYGINTSASRGADTFIPFKPKIASKSQWLTVNGGDVREASASYTLAQIGVPSGAEVVAVAIGYSKVTINWEDSSGSYQGTGECTVGYGNGIITLTAKTDWDMKMRFANVLVNVYYYE